MGTGAAVQVKDLRCYSRGLGRTLAQGVTRSELHREGGGDGCGRVGGVSMRVAHSSECRAPGTSPQVPCPPLPTAPCAGAHSADTEQTPLASALWTGAKGPAFRAPRGMRLASSQEVMPGFSWGIPGSTLCAMPGTHKTEPRHPLGTRPGTWGVSESGNTTVSKTCGFSEVLGRRHQASWLLNLRLCGLG